MELTLKSSPQIKHAELYFEQNLLFTYCKEEWDEQGKSSSNEIIREILIDYIGIVDSFHKYQICCDACNIVSKRNTDVTDDLFIALDFVFTLLVVSADANGNLVELHNFPYLQQEWTDLKETLADDYDESDTDNWEMIHAMDVLMQDYDAVLNYIKSPEMYGLYFNGYRKSEAVHSIQYGKELQHAIFEEKIDTGIKELGTQQFAEIHIEGTAEQLPQLISYTGTCTYIDGALNMCRKKIDLGSTKFNYSVRWVGLKQRFQDLSEEQ